MCIQNNPRPCAGSAVTSSERSVQPRLRPGIVLRVQDEECEILIDGHRRWVGYAAQFPRPRTERVSPSHLVAVARTSGGTEVIVWRWYDAVVLEERVEDSTLWEPVHGEVKATRRPSSQSNSPGTRAYLSAGLPGAEWWVAGPVVTDAPDADVELDEIERLYTENNLWDDLTSG
jgi:hypothetical protein